MNCKRCNNNPEKGDLFCRKCGEELPAEETFQCDCGADVCNDDRFCPCCGAMFSAGNCKSCNTDLMPNAKYCHECGAKSDEAEEGSPVSEPAQEFPTYDDSPSELSNPSEQKEEPADLEVYDDLGNVRKMSEFKEEPPKKPRYKMTGDGYYEP